MKRLTALFLIFTICFAGLRPSAFADSGGRDLSFEEALAADLKALGLFQGISETDFALGRAPTRTEAVVMFIRALGKEKSALSGNWPHPFTDVAPWADKYIGYAYENALANGISRTEFGGESNAGANMYLTFVLRALGYSDYEGIDFYWNAPFSLAKSLGILPDRVSLTGFLRADAVTVSYLALSAEMKDSPRTLADELIGADVFTKEAYETYYDADAVNSAAEENILSSKEIYAKCSPAVFYLEIENSKGEPLGSASGFFIDSSGTAVTNFHSIYGAYSATITTSDTNKVYDVLGVYDYSEEEDWAVLKIDGSRFSYLELGGSADIVGGAPAYAIGSPLGLKNTITEGLISNPARWLDGISYIQTSAAMSMGSSGGALINEYGKAIGITTATSLFGQNINLALPIDYIKDYSNERYISLLAFTVNPRSRLIPYSSYPEVPDFGAYYGVDLYRVNSTSMGTIYYYSMDSLRAAGAWSDETEYPQYLEILGDWGFGYIYEFSIGVSYYWQFAYESEASRYILLIGITSMNGKEYFSVQVTRA
jgi:hypothetical protein